MSPVERPIPPTGEEIHLPGPSAHPLLLTIGITIALIGVPIKSELIWVPGVILTVVVLFAWIRDARREYAELPLEHHAHVADTVPDAGNRPDAH